MNKRIAIYIALILLLPAISFAQDGKQIFTTKCASCHTVGKGQLVGPDLKDVDKRNAEPWLLKWISGSQAMVKAKDPRALELFQKFNMIPMPDPGLNETEIKAVLAYIKTEGGSSASSNASADNTKVAGADKSGASSGSGANNKTSSLSSTSASQNASNLKEDSTPVNSNTMFMLIGFAIIGAFFLGVIYALTHSIKKLTKALEKEMEKNK